jgi:hypothetical protein
MYTWFIAGITAVLTLVAYLRIPFGKPGAHDICSYLSLSLPLLGFVALQERPKVGAGRDTDTQQESLLPQPVDEEEAAALLRTIAAETPAVPTSVMPPHPPHSPRGNFSGPLWSRRIRPFRKSHGVLVPSSLPRRS